MAWDLSASHFPAFLPIFYFVAFEYLRQQNKKDFHTIWANEFSISLLGK
jgi:hypothetical protein